jgi:CRP-like cAMP-binding protein
MKIPNIFEGQTQPQTYEAGSVIFKEGDLGTMMYVVKSGQVELQVQGKTVEMVETDGYFGEMAIIEIEKNEPRSASAIAKTDCVLTPITAKQFEFMVHEIPFFAVHVMKGLSRRLRTTDARK